MGSGQRIRPPASRRMSRRRAPAPPMGRHDARHGPARPGMRRLFNTMRAC